MARCARLQFGGRSEVRRRKLSRPRIQREFLPWFEEASSRFAVPVLLGRRTARRWKLRFGGGTTSALRPELHGCEIGVYAEWGEDAWDQVLSLLVAPRRTPFGYINLWTLPEYREPYATREALWRSELFEPFLRWVNETLAPASHLGVWVRARVT